MAAGLAPRPFSRSGRQEGLGLTRLLPAAAPERLADDPAFSRAPRCAQVERTRHCSCEAGFQLSRAAGGDSVCQGR